MEVSFFRSKQFELMMKSPQDNKVRGLFYSVILGLQGPVDPESGMVLNLVQVDQLMARVQQGLEAKVWESPEAALQAGQSILENLVSPQADLRWLSLMFKRPGWALELRSERPGFFFRTEGRTEMRIEADNLLREYEIEKTVSDQGLEQSIERRPGGRLALIRKRPSV